MQEETKNKKTIGQLWKEHCRRLLNFSQGKKCPKCEDGRMDIWNGDGTDECSNCHHKVKR